MMTEKHDQDYQHQNGQGSCYEEQDECQYQQKDKESTAQHNTTPDSPHQDHWEVHQVGSNVPKYDDGRGDGEESTCVRVSTAYEHISSIAGTNEDECEEAAPCKEV